MNTKTSHAKTKVQKKLLKTFSMDEVSDTILGKKGTPKRDRAEKWFIDEMEQELKTREVFGSLIKMARKAEGLTQDELASRLGVKKSFISKLENSQNSTKIETILSVLKSMNLKLFIRLAPSNENNPVKKVQRNKDIMELVPA